MISKEVNLKVGSAESRQRLLKDFQKLSNDMEGLLNSFFKDKHRSIPCSDQGFTPAVDLFETETEIICLAELVGVEPYDVSVKVEAGMLLITGVRRGLEGLNNRHYHKMELEFGPFERQLTIPEPVVASSLTMEEQRGLYTLRLKKVFPGIKLSDETVDPADPDPRR